MRGTDVPGFLSTHPVTADRVKAITAQLPEARTLREQSDCKSAWDVFKNSINGF